MNITSDTVLSSSLDLDHIYNFYIFVASQSLKTHNIPTHTHTHTHLFLKSLTNRYQLSFCYQN